MNSEANENAYCMSDVFEMFWTYSDDLSAPPQPLLTATNGQPYIPM